MLHRSSSMARSAKVRPTGTPQQRVWPGPGPAGSLAGRFLGLRPGCAPGRRVFCLILSVKNSACIRHSSLWRRSSPSVWPGGPRPAVSGAVTAKPLRGHFQFPYGLVCPGGLRPGRLRVVGQRKRSANGVAPDPAGFGPAPMAGEAGRRLRGRSPPGLGPAFLPCVPHPHTIPRRPLLPVARPRPRLGSRSRLAPACCSS